LESGRLFRKETKNVSIELTQDAREKLRAVLEQPNPRLAEIPFIGLGEGGIVSDILFVNDGRYSELSGLLRSGFLGSSVDEDSQQELWDEVVRTRNLSKVIFSGHSHPSGQTEVGGTIYRVAQSMSLLEPSTGGKNNLQGGGDLAHYNAFMHLNPALNLPYIAIAAHTPSGQKLKIFDLDDLLRVNNYRDLSKTPSKIIDL